MNYSNATEDIELGVDYQYFSRYTEVELASIQILDQTFSDDRIVRLLSEKTHRRMLSDWPYYYVGHGLAAGLDRFSRESALSPVELKDLKDFLSSQGIEFGLDVGGWLRYRKTAHPNFRFPYRLAIIKGQHPELSEYGEMKARIRKGLPLVGNRAMVNRVISLPAPQAQGRLN